MRNSIHNKNQEIQTALEDGSYFQNIKPYLTETVNHIGIWGMEPSINGKYFREFISKILNYSPYIKYISIVTNGLDKIQEYFTLPLVEYTEKHHRKLKLWIQYSLDGPQSLTDTHYYQGAYKTILKNIHESTYPWNQGQMEKYYIKYRISIKPTFQAIDWHTNPVDWYNWRDIINYQFTKYYDTGPVNVDYLPFLYPTFAHGLSYTKEDGEAFARWNIKLPILLTSCTAGLSAITVDYQGNVYDCPLLCNRSDINQQQIRSNFENKMNELVANGEAIEQDRDKLFQTIMSYYCFAVDDANNLENQIRLFSNGALL